MKVKYPYVQGSKVINGKNRCSRCNEVARLCKVEWRNNMFQGDCSNEILCKECIKLPDLLDKHGFHIIEYSKEIDRFLKSDL